MLANTFGVSAAFNDMPATRLPLQLSYFSKRRAYQRSRRPLRVTHSAVAVAGGVDAGPFAAREMNTLSRGHGPRLQPQIGSGFQGTLSKSDHRGADTP